MYSTNNSLPLESRAAVIELLNNRLADAIDLKTQAKQAHWNLRGPSFFALHELFDQIASGVAGYADLLAERITQLGGTALGTVPVVAQRSTLDEYPSNLSEEHEHVKTLASALARCGTETRNTIYEADKFGDPVTADILTEISRGLDKYLWLVEAHTQIRRSEVADNAPPRQEVAAGIR